MVVAGAAGGALDGAALGGAALGYSLAADGPGAPVTVGVGGGGGEL